MSSSSVVRRHPTALPFLFFTEMWERFGYYLMIGIFLLYMTDTKKGGLALANSDASDIYGTFIALVYLTPFVGGMLADRLLGYRKAIIIGGLLMGTGYCGLALPGMTAFWGSLLLIILGNGFFKPNISTLLGNLYNAPQYRANKDVGFNIFYMGINIGAFICNFFAAYLRNTFGWGHAFAAAGVGMFIGVVIFISGYKHYHSADVRLAPQPGERSLLSVLSVVLIPAAIAGVLGWSIPGNIFGSDSTDAFLFATLPIVLFYVNVLVRAPKSERQPIAALLSIYAVVIVFWAVFKQNGTALTIWAERYTDRALPAAVVPAAAALGMTQTLTNTPDLYPQFDQNFRANRGPDGKVVKVQTTDPYFINAPHQMPSDGQSLVVISTEIFQSVNPLFVILFTPVVLSFFAWLRRRQQEPTTAAKIGWGLFISTLSSVVMIFAAWACHNGLEKSSAWWLIGTYGVVTLGELCLSPMGLSLVSKLAPARIAALMMGGWQLASAIGNKLSGVLAGMWDSYAHKDQFFMVNAALTLIATLAIFTMMRWLNRVIAAHVR